MNGSEILSLRWVLQIQWPAEVLVGGGGAGAGRRKPVLTGHAISRYIDRRVDRIVRPQVNRIVTQIACGEQPVGPDLLLDTEVPLFQIGGLQVQWISSVVAGDGKYEVLVEIDREGIAAGERGAVVLPRSPWVAEEHIGPVDRLAPWRRLRESIREQRMR